MRYFFSFAKRSENQPNQIPFRFRVKRAAAFHDLKIILSESMLREMVFIHLDYPATGRSHSQAGRPLSAWCPGSGREFLRDEENSFSYGKDVNKLRCEIK